MQLEKIKLKNFRIFKDVELSFASGDSGKNVTMVIGNNGTGKTTLQQAFSWCLYGVVEEQWDCYLNEEVFTSMAVSDTSEVSVELLLTHNKKSYTIIRNLIYRKNGTNTVLPLKTKGGIVIKYKDRDGNYQETKDKDDCTGIIREILQKELYPYFFFDGERMKGMNSSLENEAGIDELKRAVRGILNLQPYEKAIEYLGNQSHGAICKKLKKSINSEAEGEIKNLTNQEDCLSQEISKFASQIADLKKRKESTEKKITEIDNELRTRKDSQDLQKQKDQLHVAIEDKEDEVLRLYDTIFVDWDRLSLDYFSALFIKEAIEVIKDKDIGGSDIPYIHSDTINYLFKQDMCICGRRISMSPDCIEHLERLQECLPPQNIGNMVRDFKKVAKKRVDSLLGQDTLLDMIKSNLSSILKSEDDLTRFEEKLESVNQDLKTLNSDEVQQKHKQQEEYQKELERYERDLEDLNQKKAISDDQLNKIQGNLNELYLQNEKNSRTIALLRISEKILEKLKNTFNKKEEITREELTRRINDIFGKMFPNECILNVQKNYHLGVKSLLSNNFTDKLSTGQIAAATLAYIIAVVDMARNNPICTNKWCKTEPYPIVMDAPLSVLDKDRIEVISEILPNAADQIIIFIKNTDGDIAKEHMTDKIGKLYNIIQLSSKYSIVEEGE